MFTGFFDPCGRACQRSPQARACCAGKVASRVHKFSDSVRARLPALSTNECGPCGQGCRRCPQSSAVRAGKVAGAVHKRVRSLRARLPAVSTGQLISWGQGCQPTVSRAQTAALGWCQLAFLAWHLGYTCRYTCRERGIGLSWPELGPPPTRNRPVSPRSHSAPRGAGVTGEVTATRRFGVLQMSWVRSNVPLHLVATRV